jgi:hypothetical protein
MVAWVIAEYGWWLEAQRPEPDEPNEETSSLSDLTVLRNFQLIKPSKME